MEAENYCFLKTIQAGTVQRAWYITQGSTVPIQSKDWDAVTSISTKRDKTLAQRIDVTPTDWNSGKILE